MIKASFSGEYTVYKFKKGQEPEKVGKFKNLITDWGLRYQGLNNIPENICVGSSATTPNVGDMDLKGFLYQGNAQAQRGYHQDLSEPEWYISSIFTTTFDPKNKNYIVREVGFGRIAGTGIYSRSLTKDLDGNPTDITVLADEYLRVVYELRMYFKTQPTEITFTPTGDDKSPRTAKCLACKGSSYFANYKILGQGSHNVYANAILGDASTHAIQGSNLGSSYTSNVNMDATGFGGTIKLTATVSQLNGTNISGFLFGYNQTNVSATSLLTKVLISPGFTKTNEDTAEFSLHITWGRK